MNGKKYNREKIIEKILELQKNFETSFLTIEKKHSKIKVFFCTHVENLINILIKFGKTIDLTLQHDSFKKLFGPIELKEKIMYEKIIDGKRIDIFKEIEELGIELKVISNPTKERIKNKINYIERYNAESDIAWIFFFYHLKETKIKKNDRKEKCKYLLIFIFIYLSEVEDMNELNDEIQKGLEEALNGTAKKIGVPREIIIPLGNVVVSEELKRKLKIAKRKIKEAREKIKEKEKEKEQIIKEKEKEKEQIIKEKDYIIKILQDELNKYKNSN